ncbi:MAG: GGDEF domain-containing protein [Pseudobutyrivibrio sp.]|nr:GGDEF domain-containing protein [Pseudobutyrivibrio sp.]
MSYGETTFNKSKYLIENFERALEQGWIDVYYQPIIRTANGSVCGEEALARWDDPQLGMLNPSEFVPVLESVNLAHKLDLYILKKTLRKMNAQRKKGLYLVPTAVNFSQVDFYACDMVDETLQLVEESGIPKYLIAISVSEGSLNVTNQFVISQLEQFQELGFQVWLDDYGSGDAAPALLQIMHFDLLKINIFYVRQIMNSESARIIITELIRMAVSLGMETVVEGIEHKEQVDFLKEIGSTKLQGFLFCKPMTAEQIFARYDSGIAIGFENPKEANYYAEIGKVSLYDLSLIKTGTVGMENYFDTLPMAILEVNQKSMRVVRSNESYRKYMLNNFSIIDINSSYDFDEWNEAGGTYTRGTIRKCVTNPKPFIIDDRLPNGKTVHLYLRRIAVNPVTKEAAVAFVVLSIVNQPNRPDTLTYNYIARALSEDYVNLFYVDLNTNEYVEYNPDSENRDVSVESRGEDFFNNVSNEKFNVIYDEDKQYFKEAFTKEKVVDGIKENGSFTITYRRFINGKPTYVTLKAIKVRTEKNAIILGINNVDAQMKQKEVYERMKEERITYSRVMALSGDYVSIYTVDPETEHYYCFSSTEDYDNLDIKTEGDNFFSAAAENMDGAIYYEDIPALKKAFKKNKVIKEIEEKGMFLYKYRLMLDGKPTHVCLKATLIDEEDGKRLIVGVNNIETQVCIENEYLSIIKATEDKATKDQLTGVKNKRAYVDAEDEMNTRIQAGENLKFALVVCDLNGLKQVNDEKGHHAGDDYIKNGAEIICEAFAHSPVFRIGGDEFVAIVQGKDFTKLDKCLEKIDKVNRKNHKNGEVTMAVGVGLFDNDDFTSDVFERADSEMYKNKRKMKERADIM